MTVSLLAGLKGHGDVAIGNVVGSNIFNNLGILGVTSLVSPLKNPGIALSDALVMIGLSLLPAPGLYRPGPLPPRRGPISRTLRRLPLLAKVRGLIGGHASHPLSWGPGDHPLAAGGEAESLLFCLGSHTKL